MADLNSFYRKSLHAELERRVERNPKYSRNAFAKFLGMTPSYFSKLMKGTILISLDIADKVTKKLKLSVEERRGFLLSVAEEQRCHALYLIDPTITDCEPEAHESNLQPLKR